MTKTSKETLGSLCRKKTDTVEDVMAVMRAMDGVLEPTDGLKWFNLLYLTVTEGVHRELTTHQWSNPLWLQRLDVVFARLYFGALEKSLSQSHLTPHAWRPLFEARQNRKLLRLQFALAGMNAHINHDLCVALVQTAEPQRTFPRRTSGIYDDYCRVNALLEKAEAKAMEFIATGIVGVLNQSLGEADDVIAMWSVRKAREAAWISAEVLWQLRKLPVLSEQYLLRLDRMTGFAGRGLLRVTAVGVLKGQAAPV